MNMKVTLLLIIMLGVSALWFYLDDNTLVTKEPAGRWAGSFQFIPLQWHEHDPAALTQGLAYHNSLLYESTGGYGTSSLHKIAVDTGRISHRLELGHQYFAEGCTILAGKLYQITWKSRTGFVYEADSLNLFAKFHYDSDGWGITNDGELLIISNGSSRLQFINPLTFRKTREIKVRDGFREIENINELEYVNDTLFANIYGSDSICLIQPADGRVIGNLDVSILRRQMIQDKKLAPEALGVLNGIAYNPGDGHFFLTGKQWPYIIEGIISPGK